MAESRDLDLRYSLMPHFRLMEICGFWLPENFDKYKTLYKIYSIILTGATFIIYLLTEVVNIFLSLDDVSKLTDFIFIFLTHFCELFKLYYFFTYQTKFLNLLNNLNRDSFKPKNKRQLKILQSSMYNTRLVYGIYLLLCICTCFLWAVFPIFDSGGMRLPMVTWFPFDTDESPIFEIIYVYQMICIVICGISNITLDSIAAGFMAHVCAQYDILNDQILHIREQSKRNLFENHSNLKPRDYDNDDGFKVKPELQDEMDKELKRCVIHHYDLLEFTEEVSTVFNFSVFWQFLVTSIIICVALYQLTRVNLLSIQFFSMILFQCCVLTEIIVYCWYGNEIIVKSSLLSESAYFSNWVDCSPKYKRNLLIIMIRSYRPIRLYAGNLFAMSLESFTKVMRTSWSYFAVLNSMEK